MCVWASLSAHMDESFHLHKCTGQTYMWKCVLGGESRLYLCRIGAKGRGNAVSRSRLLCSLKNGSLRDYFSSLAVKLSDSNLATGLQSGGHMYSFGCVCLFMLNCCYCKCSGSPQLLRAGQILCIKHNCKDKLVHVTSQDKTSKP